MKRDHGPFDPELETLLQRGRIIPPVSDVVRARALARARATAAAATASVPAPAVPVGRRGFRIAVAACLALALGAAGATAALRGWVPRQPESTPPSQAPVIPPAPATASNLRAARPIAPPSIEIAKPQRPARPLTPQESYKAELQLLQRAQSAYMRRDFLDALILVADHGHHFPNGRLAEQREALRVRSLAGAGREDEARRAVTAFAQRFPRSVLLRRLQETAKAPE